MSIRSGGASTAVAASLVIMASVGATAAHATGFAALTLSKPVYQIGDHFRLCYTLPGPGEMTITVTDDQDAKHVLLSGDDDGTTDCLGGTVEGDPGRMCFSMNYDTSRGSGTLKTCADGTRDPAPAPAPSSDVPRVSVSPSSGAAGTQFTVDGVGFQDFLKNFNGVFVSVYEAHTGNLLDFTQMPPSLDGSLHPTLNSANYPPGEYMLGTSYTGLVGGDRAPNGMDPMHTFAIAEPVPITITP